MATTGRIATLFVLLWLCCTAEAAEMSLKPKLGCFPLIPASIEAMTHSENLGSLLCDRLDRSGYFDVMERRKLETGIELGGLRINSLSGDDLLRVGRKLGLAFIVSGTVRRGDGGMIVELRLLNVRSAGVVFRTTFDLVEYDLSARAQKLAAEIVTRAAESRTVNLAAVAEQQAPAPPGEVEITGGASKVRLKWTPPGEVAGYKIFRSVNSNGPFIHIGSSTEPAYTDESLRVNETFYYQIKSLGSNGTESRFSNTFVGKTAVAPQPPILIKVIPEIQGAQLVWRPRPADAGDPRLVVAGYRIYRKAAGESGFRPVGKASVNDTVTIDAGLKEGEVYGYTMTSFNGDNIESEYSTAVEVTPVPAVRHLRVDGVRKRNITVTWEPLAHPGIVGYLLYRSEKKEGPYLKVGTVEGRARPVFTDTAPAGSTTYWYRVAAFNNAGRETAPGEPASGTTEGKLPVPSGLSALSGLARKVRLVWEPTGSTRDDIKAYHVYRSDSADGPYAKIGETRTPSYIDGDKPLLDDKTYFYKITCSDGTGEESPLSIAVAATTMPLPSIPGGLSATSGDVGKVTLSWTANPEKNIKLYEIYRGTPEKTTVTMIDRVAGTSYQDSGLKPGVAYLYAVKAVNDEGMASIISSVVTGTTKPLPKPPSRVRVTAKDGSRELSWEPNTEPDLSGYAVYRKNFLGMMTRIATVTAPHHRLDPVTGDMVVYVTAIDRDELESEPAEVLVTK